MPAYHHSVVHTVAAAAVVVRLHIDVGSGNANGGSPGGAGSFEAELVLEVFPSVFVILCGILSNNVEECPIRQISLLSV